ncbi:MAG: hypothetical protein LBH59_07150, partial [Planctomycetaceae bacterium]|nr:hypothetical protein [Planctomycetaceae bacterium]
MTTEQKKKKATIFSVLIVGCSNIIPMVFLICFASYFFYQGCSITVRTGKDIKKVWWLPEECSNVSYSFYQSDEIYEYNISDDSFHKATPFERECFVKIGECPVKIIRYTAIGYGWRVEFLSEINNLTYENQHELSHFRIVRKGYYCLREYRGNIMYYVFDEEQQKMYCYMNLGKNGIYIGVTDPFHEYVKD